MEAAFQSGGSPAGLRNTRLQPKADKGVSDQHHIHSLPFISLDSINYSHIKEKLEGTSRGRLVQPPSPGQPGSDQIPIYT